MVEGMISNLSIRWKIILCSFLILAVTVAIVSMLWILSLKRNSDREIAQFRQTEVKKIKQNLEDFVNIAYETIKSNHESAGDMDFMIKRYGRRLVSIIDLCNTIIAGKMTLAENGIISVDEAKRQAAQEIKQLRYDDGKGYIWINDTGKPYPKMVMHPTAPSLDGKILDNPKYFCALGKNENLFKAFVDVTTSKGEGFVDYLWPKPTREGLTKRQPKLSYVRLINEWHWIIGTGIYVDDAITDAITKIKHDVRSMRYSNGTGYFWINDTTKPFPKMIMHPLSPQLENKTLNSEKYNRTKGENKNLFTAMVDVSMASGAGFVEYTWPKPTQKGQTENLPKLSYVKRYEKLNWIIGTGVYIDEIDRIVEHKTAASNKQISDMILLSVGVTLILLIPALVALWFIAASITNPILLIVNTLKQIRQGDFSVEMKQSRKDEIGQIIEALIEMVESVSNLIRQIDAGVGTLKNSASKMSDISNQLNENSAETAQKANTVAAAAEETDSNLLSFSAAMEETSTNMDTVAAATVEIGAGIETITSNSDVATNHTQNAVDKANQVTSKVNELGTAAEKIEIVSSTISDISDKIDLLALNATIEAARAGDAGRGFAVVANEIKELAKQAADATTDIAEKLGGIQELTADTISLNTEIFEITNQVNVTSVDINHSVTQQSTAVQEISKNINQVSGGLKEINQKLNETSQATSQVAREIGEVQENANLISNSAASAKHEAEELNSLADRLKERVDLFTIKQVDQPGWDQPMN